MPFGQPIQRPTTPINIQELVSSIGVNILATSQNNKFKRMYENDRIAFVYDCMPNYGKTITPYQEYILGLMDDGYKRIAVRGPHGLGKTFLAAIIVHHAVLTSSGDCKIPTTASAWRQLEKYLWPEIKKASNSIAWPRVGRQPYDPKVEFLQNEIKLRDLDVLAFALASDDHATLEGAHAKKMQTIFDEAKNIPVPTWDALEGAFSNEGLTNADIMAFAISTPGDPSGRFYDIHSRKPGYEDWLPIHVTLEQAINAGRISVSWAEQRRKQWGETSSMYLNRVLGEFADNSEDAMIPLSWVKLAHARWLEWDKAGRPSMGPKLSIGVDVARMGEDATVLAVANAWAIQQIHTIRKVPLTAIAGRITALAKELGYPSINIEMEGGYGSSVYDMLKQNNIPNLRPINVSHKTMKRTRDGTMGFVNVRSAMWWNLREMLDPINGDGVMLPTLDRLVTDLTAPGWELTSGGDIKMESRDGIVEKIGVSPDYGTAVALALWKQSSGGGVVF